MTPQERQVRILEFIERYQRERHDAPTVREIVVGSGVSSYQDIQGDIDALLQRRLAAWVDEAVSGSEPFSSRQVKSTRAPAAGAPPASAPPAPPAPATRAPFGGTPSGRPAAPTGPGVRRPVPPAAARPAGTPRASGGGGSPSGWGSAASGAPGATAEAPAGRPAARPAMPRANPAAPPPIDRGRALPTGGQRPLSPAPGGPARPAGSLRASLSRWGLSWQLALAAAAIAALLVYLYLRAGAELPLRPALSLRGQSHGLWGAMLVSVWGLAGLGLGLGLERRAWLWSDVAHGLLWGALGGLIYLAARFLGLERLQSQASELTPFLRLAGAALETLPVLLALRFAPFAGAATLAQAAALAVNSLTPGGPAFWMLPVLQAPVLALPGELALLLPPMDHDRRGMLVGAALGALQQSVGAAFLPVGSWPSPLAGALAGAAMGWLLAQVSTKVQGGIARLGAGRP